MSGAAFVTQADLQKDSLLLNAGQVLNIKEEPEEQPSLGSFGLQEITLDDGELVQRHTSLKVFMVQRASDSFLGTAMFPHLYFLPQK